MEERQLPVPLSTSDKSLGSLVNEAVNQTLSRYQLDADAQSHVYAFLLELTGGTPLYLLLSQDGIDRYHPIVFGDDKIRNLVFSIHSAFVGRYSAMSDDWNALYALISRAGSIRTNDTTSSMPEVITDRLYTAEDIYAVLGGNSWLVVLALIVMYWNNMLVSNTSKRG